MATTSERMIAAKVEFIEYLRELPPAAYARRVDQGGAQGSRCCDAPPVGGGRRALAADVLPRLHAVHGRQGQEDVVGLVRDQGES